MSCERYYEVIINSCPDSIKLAGLTAATVYIWFLKDKFKVNYSGEATTDADGVLTIPVDGTPLTKDMFQSFSGDYQLRIQTEDRVPVQLCSNTIDYVLLALENFDPQLEESIIINPCS